MLLTVSELQKNVNELGKRINIHDRDLHLFSPPLEMVRLIFLLKMINIIIFTLRGAWIF